MTSNMGDDEEPAGNISGWLRSNKLLAIGSLIVFGLIVVVLALMITIFAKSYISIPKDVTDKITYPIYLPKELPNNYQVDEESFTVVEEGNVLIFQAKNGVSGELIFSEQPKPKDFDFDDFHTGNLKNPETLSDVPYPSVWGKSGDGRSTISIVTDETWILVVTSAPLVREDMAKIARGIQGL